MRTDWSASSGSGCASMIIRLAVSSATQSDVNALFLPAKTSDLFSVAANSPGISNLSVRTSSADFAGSCFSLLHFKQDWFINLCSAPSKKGLYKITANSIRPMCPGQSFSKPHVLQGLGPILPFKPTDNAPIAGACRPLSSVSPHSSKAGTSSTSSTLISRNSCGEKYMNRTSEASLLHDDAAKSNGVLVSMVPSS
eukprot:CAMPEP_0204154750 /NCGR_PEP_ID=MMETSP0361-20130328/28991_1 /ASSEMBLY_ACC=CAM_ASM_000343 /TAXON_ID=268821 /ORGANISM="Scrippsiella Hangoei, Strain SHTV-5" /LENGTH=195 /DNA_ID=CAMNT_0051110073 /DNA_START=33 /DNA_END=617 /DNA_ORIENTATION=+